MDVDQSEIITSSSSAVVLGSAGTAFQGDFSVEGGLLKDDFDVLVKTGLAYVVKWLRRDWIPIMSRALGPMGSVDKGAGVDFVQNISPALRDEFFHFAQLLQCLEVSLLQLAHLETVSQESFLSLQNLLIHLRDFDGDQIAIADADHGGTEVFS